MTPPIGPVRVLAPNSVSASTVTQPWIASNVLVEDGRWWMSAVNSNSPEWLLFDFGAAVTLTFVVARCGLGRHGAGNRIQGSTDGRTWVDLHAFVATGWNYQSTGQTYTSAIQASGAYRYVRLYSDPSPYCLYDFVQFQGR